MPRRKITIAEKHAFHVERGKLEAQLKIKEKMHKIELENLFLSVREYIGKMLDNTSVRDWIYVLSFLSATYLAYITLSKIEIGFIDFWSNTFFFGILGKIFPRQVEEVKIEIDQTLLAQSMIAAYVVLKLDLGDVSSAVTKIAPMISSIVGTL